MIRETLYYHPAYQSQLAIIIICVNGRPKPSLAMATMFIEHEKEAEEELGGLPG